MTTEELKEKYFGSPLAVRLAIMTVLGLIVPGYHYSEESKVVESSLEAEQQKLQEAQTKLAEQKQAKVQIPAREKTLDEADKRINDVRRTLPPAFEVHEVLRKVELLAKQNSVVLTNFKPTPEANKSMYIEMLFGLRVEGKFVDVTRYVDDLLHFETLTKIKLVNYSPKVLQERQVIKDSTAASTINTRKNNAIVTADIDFMVYKSVGI
jgi:Tfp pilus assembly protein PilO